MRFSIVIPTWEYYGKGVFFLKELFDSIKAQTFTDFEVVVSDHSQNDEIENLCFELSREFSVVYIRNNSQRGNGPANLNNALKHATGEIIKIMFQDDFFIDKGALNLIDSHFRLTPCSWLVNGYCTAESLTNLYGHNIPRWNDNIVTGRNTIGSPTVLSFVNKDIILFDENLVMLMDCDYYCALHRKFGPPCILEDFLVAGRWHKDQISRNYTGDLGREIQIIKNKQL